MIGQVTSLYDPSSNSRILLGPDGTQSISTAGTATQGVNEGIAYAIANGWAFRCLPHEQVVCTSYLHIPPCFNADIDLGGTEFKVTGANLPALFMDSFNGGRFHHSGILLHTGGGAAAVVVSPRNADPVASQIIIQNADITFGWLQTREADVGYGVYFELSHDGSVMNNKLRCHSADGWDGAASRNRHSTSIYVSPTNDQYSGFNENIITVLQCMGFSQVGIGVGASGNTNNLYIGDNEWDVMLNSTGTSSQTPSAFIDSFASYDEWRLSGTVYTGSMPVGLILHGNYNSYKTRQNSGSTAVQDFGTGNRAI